MPSFINTPELARNIDNANAVFAYAKQLLYSSPLTPRSKASLQPDWTPILLHDLQLRKIEHSSSPSFWALINLQDIIYRRVSVNGHDITSQSLLSQIHAEFSAEKMTNIKTCRGIVFIDFDDTIFNWTKYTRDVSTYEQIVARAGRPLGSLLPPISDVHYNGVDRLQWIQLLASLKRKGFLIVLCTNRSASGKDQPYRKIRRELGPHIDCEIFMSFMGGKGFLMEMICDYIRKNYYLEFSRESFYLVDDQDENLHLAHSLGFKTIKAGSVDNIQMSVEPISANPAMHQLYPHFSYAHTLKMTSAGPLKSLIPSLHELPVPTFIAELKAIQRPGLPKSHARPQPKAHPTPPHVSLSSVSSSSSSAGDDSQGIGKALLPSAVDSTQSSLDSTQASAESRLPLPAQQPVVPRLPLHLIPARPSIPIVSVPPPGAASIGSPFVSPPPQVQSPPLFFQAASTRSSSSTPPPHLPLVQTPFFGFSPRGVFDTARRVASGAAGIATKYTATAAQYVASNVGSAVSSRTASPPMPRLPSANPFLDAPRVYCQDFEIIKDE